MTAAGLPSIPIRALSGNHGIGGNVDDYLVDMQFKDAGGFGVNQAFYGGTDLSITDNRVGAYWRSLNASSISFYRRPEDAYAKQVRVRIFRAWKPCPPNYDSGWTALSPDQSRTLSHTLGGSADNYLVDMQFKSDDLDGINQRYYGGADFGSAPAPGHVADDRVGAYWRSLTNSAITVYRRPEDTYVNQARLRIWSMPRPDFDSGWVTLAQNVSQVLTHNLGGNILDYFVYMEQKAPDINGINQRYYGGTDFGLKTTSGNPNDRVGAYWRSLTNSAVTVYRRPEDTYAGQVRIRIWRVASPDYSGFPALVPDNSVTLAHNVGLPPENFLVSMMYADNDAANGVNQRYFGGKDFGTQPSAGYNADDRVGAYWRSLTSNEITVYRRPEDGFADWILIRIWGVPPRIYLPLIFRN